VLGGAVVNLGLGADSEGRGHLYISGGEFNRRR
jgi:hypothetical protein